MTTMIDEARAERLSLLGTAQAGDIIELPGDLEQALTGKEDISAQRLMIALGTASLMRKAGQLPIAPDAFPAWDMAPTETMPALGTLGEQCLRAILEEEDAELLSNYIDLLASHQRRIPALFIVPLMSLAGNTKSLAQRILVQAGERGAWLGKHNPDWSALLSANATTNDPWNTGTLAQRAAYLMELRQQDPAQARELLAAGLKQESSKELPMLLNAMHTGLSLADAPLIEPLLKSKARDVRATTAALLVRMPGHPSQDTLFNLCATRLELKGNMILGRRLEVSLPEAYDPTWSAFGIEPKSGRFPTERTAWLGQMIALVHPKRWCERFERSEEDLVLLAQKNEYSAMLLAALTDAALLHDHQPMISALLRAGMNADDHVLWQQLRSADLWAAVDSSTAEAVLMPVVDRATSSRETNDRLAWLLSGNTRDWSPKLADRVLDWLERIAPKPDDSFNWSQAHQLSNALRRSVPPSLSTRVDTMIGKLRETASPAYLKLLEQLAKRLRLRQRMLDSINEPSPVS
jgi:hypothetical protein